MRKQSYTEILQVTVASWGIIDNYEEDIVLFELLDMLHFIHLSKKEEQMDFRRMVWG